MVKDHHPISDINNPRRCGDRADAAAAGPAVPWESMTGFRPTFPDVGTITADYGGFGYLETSCKNSTGPGWGLAWREERV